jgi:RNA polymerase sigma-70 factor (ECF subfamily)
LYYYEYMETAEINAIIACQKGNNDQFAFLYDKYIKKIYDFVYYKTSHKETAEDIVSQVFFKAIERINTFKVNKGTFQAWLYQIARNSVIDFYRTKKEVANIDDYWSLSDNTDIERDTEARIRLEEVDAYLKKLKPLQREIIIMRVWQGLGYAEISEIIGKSEASCKMLFSRTIKRLRKEMPMEMLIMLLLFN